MSTRSLRHYERSGLLLSKRAEDGNRYYSADAEDRVRAVEQLLFAGLPMRSIIGLLDLLMDQSRTIQAPQARDLLERETARLEQHMKLLEASYALLLGALRRGSPESAPEPAGSPFMALPAKKSLR